ncbi:MAG: hypothetical protein HUJ60_00460 [Bacilli bacterium]|nr:hypothetical protein [Bacilli bacterium]
MPKITEPYKCVYALNNEILFLTGQLAYNIGRLKTISRSEATVEDHAYAVKASLAAEGIEISPSQMRALKRGEKIETLPEADGLMKLYRRLGNLDPADQGIIGLYEEAMFPNGAPHRKARRVASFPYPIPMHAKLEGMMRGVFHFIRASRGKLFPLSVAALAYFEIMALQPYSSLTGPLAKFLMKAVLAYEFKELAALPIEELMNRHKKEIDAAWEASLEKGDSAPFILRILRLIDIGVKSLLKEALRSRNSGSPLVEKLLAKMEPDKFYSAQELLNLLGLKSRLGLQKNYLRPGIEARKIEMLNPLTPTDRNQKYRKA